MNKKYDLVILGGGVSGRAALALAEKHGKTGVILNDGEPGGELPETPLIVTSPGLAPLKSRLWQLARQSGREFISELEYGFRHLKLPVLAVTGTNGKTTTTELTTHLLNALGVRAVAAGNIGLPLSAVAADPGDAQIAVVEVSNFQLELAPRFAPRAAVLLNLASDHEDRYKGGFEEYCAVKRRIFTHVPEADRIYGLSFSAASRRVTLRGETLLIDGLPALEPGKTALNAPHNRENLAAACELLLRVLPAETLRSQAFREAAAAFRPGAHRMELVAKKNGIRCINDSKATNPAAVIAAVRACGESPCVLLLGGLDKGMDFTELFPILPRVRTAVLYGEAEEKLHALLAARCRCLCCGRDFDRAVHEALLAAQPGDTVLLSPACASMDLFRNYQERGERFRQLVQQEWNILS